MPVDPFPMAYGDLAIGETLVTLNGDVVVNCKGRESKAVGYVSHFSTCPYVADYKKQRG